jgi:hypothetical protein
MPGVLITGQLDVRWPSLLDQRSGKLVGSKIVPYDTLEEAYELVSTRRAEGLVLYVRNEFDSNVIDWYQFQGGVENEHLIRIELPRKLSGPITIPDEETEVVAEIVLPLGWLIREFVLKTTVETVVNIGNTEGGNEIADTIVIPASSYAVFPLARKLTESASIFVSTPNNLTYEIYLA